jgi:nitrile hydratase
MRKAHDRGGWPGAGPIDRSQHELADWELLAEAVSFAIGEKGIRCTDESRRTQESLPPDVYESLGYYERWISGAEKILVEKGVLRQEDIDRKVAELERQWA